MKIDPRISVGLLILRLGVGLVMVFYGLQKALGLFGGHGYVATVEMFTKEMQIPAVFAHLAIIAELAGGLGILVGFLTPVAAFGVFCTMVVATYKMGTMPGALQAMVTTGNPADASRLLYPAVLALAALALLITGAGAYSLDARLFRSRRR
jgi:putative oxidoreductase